MAVKTIEIQRGRPTEMAFRSLIRTLGLLKRVMEPHFARFGISGSQWGVLRTLHRAEEDGMAELRLTDLGDRLLIRPASVSGAVDRLQRLGLLARVASTTDQRAKNVNLTSAGRELVRRVLERHADHQRPRSGRKDCRLKGSEFFSRLGGIFRGPAGTNTSEAN